MVICRGFILIYSVNVQGSSSGSCYLIICFLSIRYATPSDVLQLAISINRNIAYNRSYEVVNRKTNIRLALLLVIIIEVLSPATMLTEL